MRQHAPYVALWQQVIFVVAAIERRFRCCARGRVARCIAAPARRSGAAACTERRAAQGGRLRRLGVCIARFARAAPSIGGDALSARSAASRYSTAGGCRASGGGGAAAGRRRRCRDNLVSILLARDKADEAMPLILSNERCVHPSRDGLRMRRSRCDCSAGRRRRELYDCSRLVRTDDLEPPAG